MLRALWVVAALLLLPQQVAADAFDDAFAEQNRQFNQMVGQQNHQYKKFVSEQDAAWNRYVAEQNAAWKRYSAEIDAVWGQPQAKLPSQKVWVDYSKKRDARSSIDFEHGKLQVDLLLNPGESAQSASAQARIKQQLEKMITQSAHEDPALKVSPPSTMAAMGARAEPVYPLNNQLALANGTMVTRDNADQFAQETIQSQAMVHKTVQTPNGRKQLVSLSVNLIPNHLQRRARPYVERAKAMARRFAIPTSLILGIMQTESSFNPMARNGVPAFGLMQLVPISGARDAYRYLFNTDKVVSAAYLFNPTNNIELGSAYLKLLQIREMKLIKNAKTRMLCAIAAYNTGGGNVAKAFIPGSHNIRKASAIINTMSYQQVYDYLRAHLPYAETQRYVMKVRKYMKNYTSLDGV